MNKEAIAAKSLLKALAIGAGTVGVAGGAGYLGHQIGYKGGATKATNEMASAFSEANTQENQQIRDSFNMFNKRENQAIASNYMRRGMALGAELHATGKIKTPAEMAAMSKTSSVKGEEMNKQAYLEEIYNAAFDAELEKNSSWIGTTVMGGLKTLGKSFKNLGSGAKDAFRQARAMRGSTGQQKMLQKKYLKEGIQKTIKGSKPALYATAGAGAGAAGGYALG